MITVLVVDDDFRVARIHAAFVTRTGGYQVVGVAHTGQEALAAANRLQPDLILLDLYLPDVFGLDLVNSFRIAGVESDLIVISAANESETVERALKLGVANYLLKPFTMADLVARLTAYRAQRRKRRPPALSDQAEVDRLFGRQDARPAPVPKGMSAETTELVLKTLADAGRELSASECADACGMARVSARRYLEHFVGQGRVRVSLRYGTRGRPERLYQVS